MEMEFESTLLGGLPAWVFEAVLPLGFAIISLCYLFHAVKSVTCVLGHCPNEDET